MLSVFLSSRLYKINVNCDAEAFSLMEITQSSGVRSQLIYHGKDRFVAMRSIFFEPHPNLCCVHQGTLPFMSKRLLRALELGTCALHTAADDLESFLWVLVWSLAHILKRAVGETITDQISSINNLAEHLSSRFIPSILSRELTVMDEWKEKVFGGLLHDWLKISQKSRTVVAGLQVTLLRSLDDVKLREECLDLIDEHCIKVYQEFFRTGYEHFETIKEHRDWEAVVNFNGDLLKN